MISANIKLKVKDPKSLYKALEPDIEKTKQFNVEIKPKENLLSLNVKAKDISAMRAALNSYLRLISVIEELDG